MKAYRFFVFAFLFSIIFQHAAIAQVDALSYPQVDKAYVFSYFSDTKSLLLSPVKWQKKDWIIFSSAIAASALISTQDVNVYRFFNRNKNSTTESISTYGLEPWGSGLYSMGSMGLLYIGGKIFQDKKAEGASLNATKSFLLSSLLVTIAKQLVHRHRPYQVAMDTLQGSSFSQYFMDGPQFKGSYFKYTSFPSGHTTAIFAVASSIAYSYRDKPWVSLLAYSAAGLTGISRIHDDKHWASDVFMGAALGWAVGRFVSKHNEWKISPAVGFNQMGVRIQIE